MQALSKIERESERCVVTRRIGHARAEFRQEVHIVVDSDFDPWNEVDSRKAVAIVADIHRVERVVFHDLADVSQTCR